MVPWRLQKRFFQNGHSVSTPVPNIEEIEKKKSEKKIKKRKLPKKGKVNNPPESVWRDVGSDNEVVEGGREGGSAGGSGNVDNVDCIDDYDEDNNSDNDDIIENEFKKDMNTDSVINTDIKMMKNKIQKEIQKEVEKEVEIEEISPEGKCEHMREEGDQLVFERYCHVYQAGELEDLCSW